MLLENTTCVGLQLSHTEHYFDVNALANIRLTYITWTNILQALGQLFCLPSPTSDDGEQVNYNQPEYVDVKE